VPEFPVVHDLSDSEAVLLPKGFVARYELLCDNGPESLGLLAKVDRALMAQNYILACKLLKLEKNFEVETEPSLSTDNLSNIAWRRLQMLPPETQKLVERALKANDLRSANRILKVKL